MTISKKCEYCPKKFKGETEHQVDSYILIHKINKHPEKIKIKTIK